MTEQGGGRFDERVEVGTSVTANISVPDEEAHLLEAQGLGPVEDRPDPTPEEVGLSVGQDGSVWRVFMTTEHPAYFYTDRVPKIVDGTFVRDEKNAIAYEDQHVEVAARTETVFIAVRNATAWNSQREAEEAMQYAVSIVAREKGIR